MIEGIGVLLRLRLKDKTPPCIINFRPEDRRRDIYKVYYSHDLREPDENANHGVEVNVSYCLKQFKKLIRFALAELEFSSIEPQNCPPWCAPYAQCRLLRQAISLQQRLAVHQLAVGAWLLAQCARLIQIRLRPLEQTHAKH